MKIKDKKKEAGGDQELDASVVAMVVARSAGSGG